MIVVDSSALVAILKQEPDAGILARSLATQSRRLISAATYLECGVVTLSKLGAAGLAELDGLASHLMLELVPFDDEQARAGVNAHRRYGRGSGHPAKLNFGDCFSYALARTRNLPLLFKGDDFVHTDIRPALKPA
jgi:ribonuclease VapC